MWPDASPDASPHPVLGAQTEMALATMTETCSCGTADGGGWGRYGVALVVLGTTGHGELVSTCKNDTLGFKLIL